MRIHEISGQTVKDKWTEDTNTNADYLEVLNSCWFKPHSRVCLSATGGEVVTLSTRIFGHKHCSESVRCFDIHFKDIASACDEPKIGKTLPVIFTILFLLSISLFLVFVVNKDILNEVYFDNLCSEISSSMRKQKGMCTI